MRLLVPFALIAMAAAQARAQTEAPSPPDPTTTITVTARIVALDALVHTRDGTLVTDLNQQDFSLKVDGHAQPIRYFNRDQDLPLTVGLLFDTSESQHPYFDDEALAGSIFLRDVLTHPDDRAFLLSFDTNVFLLQPFTHALPALNNGLRLLGYRANALSAGAQQTHLYDAILHTCTDVLAADPARGSSGRRAILVLTDGFDVGSRARLEDAVHAAQQANIAVYSILYTREMATYPHVPGLPSGIEAMRTISEQTGGREFVVEEGVRISDIFGTIAQELRSQYRFGFTPPESKPGKFHRIELKTADPRLVARSRAGYFEK
jgi:VWFA-related protein